MRLIQALQGDVLLSPSCKISYFSLPVYITIDTHVFYLDIEGEGGGGGVFP